MTFPSTDAVQKARESIHRSIRHSRTFTKDAVSLVSVRENDIEVFLSALDQAQGEVESLENNINGFRRTLEVLEDEKKHSRKVCDALRAENARLIEEAAQKHRDKLMYMDIAGEAVDDRHTLGRLLCEKEAENARLVNDLKGVGIAQYRRLESQNAALTELIKKLEAELARRDVQDAMSRGLVTAIRNIRDAVECSLMEARDAYHKYGSDVAAIAALRGEEVPHA